MTASALTDTMDATERHGRAVVTGRSLGFCQLGDGRPGKEWAHRLSRGRLRRKLRRHRVHKMPPVIPRPIPHAELLALADRLDLLNTDNEGNTSPVMEWSLAHINDTGHWTFPNIAALLRHNKERLMKIVDGTKFED